MPSDKARLYVALYHWALLVAPKNENNDSTGMRYHAKNAPGQSTWVFEEKPTSITATNMMLVRFMIGKINDPHALAAKLRQVPVVNENLDWNCVNWLKSALALIAQDTSLMGISTWKWQTVRAASMQHCEQKTAQGRFRGEGNFDTSKVPTFDLLQGKEMTK
ncbi:hypothetical protein PMZ80_011144 [Knufia obscura]|uniref:Uncharacterized protein n=1 Tax=Knufia obscura TaxID=1635080 RepID=A0ABR0R7L8_9EURO|nr:hypothetical protein PMZ80_011144 [Knufia obscura]